MAGFWTRRTERAALLVAEDQLTDAAIAKELGVVKATVENWKKRPEFRARVQGHVEAFAAALRAKGIADRQNRVDALNERWAAMQQVIAARAADPTMTAPGAKTGLLVRTYKPGKFRVLEEYRFDAALVAELRAHEKQAAEELGQWVARNDVTSGGEKLDLASLVLLASREPGGDDGGHGGR